MKKSIMFSILAIVSLVALFIASKCTSEHNSENNIDKLQKNTYQVICNILLKTTNRNGQVIYVDSKGEAYFQPNAAKSPFTLSGSGCLLGQSHFATVAHISPKIFDENGFMDLIKKAELEQDTIFFKNLSRSIDDKLLVLPTNGGKWEYFRVNSFIIPQGAYVGELIRTLEESPFKIPDGCIEIQNPKESMSDLAIYELKKNPTEGVEGFSLEDIASDADIKAFKQQKSKIYDVVSWGYPVGIFTNVSDNVTPQPCKGQVTVWPNSTFPFVQTNLRTNHGASGSFVLTMQGKVIGLVAAVDSTNTNNTLCIPASLLRDMFQEISELPK